VKVGDHVWTSYLNPSYTGGVGRQANVRAEVLAVFNEDHGGFERVTLRFADGRTEERWADECESYSAVDSLADLVRCPQCVGFGRDNCPKHSGFVFAADTVSSTSTWATFDGLVAATTDPITLLGDLVRPPERRHLTYEERVSRRKARKRARRSRRRNRR